MSVKLDIAGNKCVASMGRRLAKISEFAHDYANDPTEVGAVVKMPVLSCEAGVFNETTNNYEQSNGTTEAAIPVSEHYVAGFEVTPIQMSDGLGAWNDLFNRMGDQAGRAIARAVEKDVVGQVLSSNSAETLTATKAGFAQLYKIAMDNDLDPSNTILVLNAENYAKLLEVLGADVVNLQYAIENGYIDNFLGFRRILASGSVDASLKGFMAEYGAIGIVGRRIPLLDETTYPWYASYTDEESGIPVTLIGFNKFATGKVHITATALFGTAIVDSKHVIPLV